MIGSKLLSQVKRDLNDTVKVCNGELKQTNHLRTLMSSLTKGEFSMHTALSREEPGRRVYVQDVVRSRAEELKDLVLNRGAHVYVCGDAARMAKDVFKAFEDIVDDGVDGLNSGYLKGMKASGRWSEDVW